MFKQQQKAEPNIGKQKPERREDGQNRMAGFGIKVISNWMDDRKGSNTSQNKREQGKSPILKNDPQPSQPLSKVSSTRGIKVISSRQASNERPYVTSRSNSKQKQSKEIKSQTNISEFDSAVNSKEPSFEKQQPGRQFDPEGVIEAMEKRFKEAILKQRVLYEVQIDELRQVIASNEERIDNLIVTLNQMMEGGGRKDKGLGRLQSRISSNQKYAEQCYEYTLSRCSDSEIILRHLFETIDRGSIKNIQIDNKMEYIERIMVDIFTIQKKFVHHQQNTLHNEIKKLNEYLHKLESRLGEIQQLELRHSLEDMRSVNWKEHLLELREQLEAYAHSGMQGGNHAQPANYAWIQKEQLAIKIQSLEFKLAQLETAKIALETQYRDREEHSQQAIRELSSLLNKQERDLQKIQRQNNSLLSYNKQIENKLIQSRCKENSMQLYVQNQIKSLENSKISEQNSRIIAQNQTFRQKYESLFRHNQYLQDINCKNNLELINTSKVIEDLQERLQQAEKQAEEEIKLQYKMVALCQEIEGLKRKLAQSHRKIQEKQGQVFTKSMEVQSMLAETTALKNQIHEYDLKTQQLQAQLEQILTAKEALQNELNQIRNQFLAIQKDLQEEELYSQHLQKENEKLEIKLQEYTQNFEEQSQMFRTTIDRLKRQREQVRYSEPKTDRPVTSKQSSTQSFSKTTIPQSNSSNVKSQQQKLLRLMKAIDAAGYKKPVPCEIDGAGYLKHLDEGTYIIDAHQNLFQLSTEEKHLAIRTNLIQLFQ